MKPLDVALAGTQLVEASAGTGKTYTITTLVLRLLLDGLDRAGGGAGRAPLSLREILVVTFTRAATSELKERVRRRLREALTAYERDEDGGDPALAGFLARSRARDGGLDRDRRLLARALQSFDEAQIFTIHSFCQRVLQDNAFECGATFDAELIVDQKAVVREVVEDFWVRRVQSQPLAVVEKLLEDGLTPSKLVKLGRMVVDQPDIEVRPPAVLVDVGAALTAWREARDAAADAYAGQAEEIRAQLLTGVLNRAHYKEERVHRLVAAAARHLRRTAPAARGRRPGGGTNNDSPFAPLAQGRLNEATRKGLKAPRHPFFETCDRLAAIENEIAELVERAVTALVVELVAFARAECAARKAVASTQSFDDLLQGLHRAVTGPGGAALAATVRARYPAALIDEFQDTDPVQYDIFKSVYGAADGGESARGPGGARALFLIGDPKQAIYAFRGADIFSYLDAKRSAAGAPHALTTNRRSDPGLVRAVNALFSGARDPFVFPEIAFHDVVAHAQTDALTMNAPGPVALVGGERKAPAFEILFAPRRPDEKRLHSDQDGGDVPWWTAAEIAHLLAAGAELPAAAHGATPDGARRPVEPGDIAVLCRTNRQAHTVQRALRELRIPNVLQGDASVYDTLEAEELERVLRAVVDPAAASAVRAALATSILGQGAVDIARLQTDDAAWDAVVAKLQSWHEAWAAHGFIAALRRLLDDEQLEARLLRRTDGERRVTNLLHLGELLQQQAVRGHLGPTALVEWLRVQRIDEDARAQGAEQAQMRLESDAHATKVLTVHKAKGLEYPIVYCPFLWTGSDLFADDRRWPRFHDPATGEMVLDVGSADLDAAIERALHEQRAEVMRVAYVALTRARHRCTILCGAFPRFETSPLAWLLHQDPADPRVDPGARFTANIERVGALDDDALRGDLARFAAAVGDTVVVRDLTRGRPPVWAPPAQATAALRRDEAERKLDVLFRLGSYSSLTAATKDAGGRALDVDRVRDRDESAAPDDDDDLAAPATVPLAALPAGARTGNLVHWVLEHTDFTQDDDALATQVAAGLQRFRIAGPWRQPLTAALRGALHTPLVRAGGFRLADVPKAARMDEMDFMFPLLEHVDSGGALHSGQLGAVLAAHGGAFLPAGYAAAVQRLGFAPIRGFLHGAMDVALRHDGRWYVVDYKSSKLGVHVDDYAPARLALDMSEHHYHLQALIYTVALHRFLTFRLGDAYRYDAHFGGVLYLYIRGMAPEHPKDTGVHFARPSWLLVEALDRLFGHGAADAHGADAHGAVA